MNTSQRIDVKQLADLHQVSVRQIRSWVSKGLRHGSKKDPRGGKKIWTFNNERDVIPWLAKEGIVTANVIDMAHHRLEGSATRDLASSLEAVKDGVGIIASVERVKAQEIKTSDMYLTLLLDKKSTLGEIEALQRLYFKQVDALRKGEMGVIAHKIRTGALGEKAANMNAFTRIATATLNSLLGVGHTSAQKISPLLSNQNDTPMVRKVIDDAVKQALRNLGSVINEQ